MLTLLTETNFQKQNRFGNHRTGITENNSKIIKFGSVIILCVMVMYAWMARLPCAEQCASQIFYNTLGKAVVVVVTGMRLSYKLVVAPHSAGRIHHVLSCTRLRVPPVALHVSRYTCRATRVAADFLDFRAFCRCSTGVALHPLKILVSHLSPPPHSREVSHRNLGLKRCRATRGCRSYSCGCRATLCN